MLSAGFAVFWDFILGMSSSYTKCRIATGVYQGTDLATDVKVLPSVSTSVLTKAHHPGIPAGGAAVLGMKHPFPRSAFVFLSVGICVMGLRLCFF